VYVTKIAKNEHIASHMLLSVTYQERVIFGLLFWEKRGFAGNSEKISLLRAFSYSAGRLANK
jgi:hypothetical protein